MQVEADDLLQTAGDAETLTQLLASDAVHRVPGSNPLSGDHNEMLFIVQHQATELWMKLIIHELTAARDRIAASDLQPAFKMLDPVGLATKLIHLDEKIGDDDFVRFFLAMETWLEDSVSFPGRAFADFNQAH